MDTRVKSEVISMLQQLSAYKANSTNTQHTVRCAFCGDSVNEQHGHFSIRIDVDSDEPMIFRCFKCDVSGILNNTILEELGLSVSTNLRNGLVSFNKKIVKKNKFVTAMENFVVPVFQNNLSNTKKLDYINLRLGTDMDYYRAQELKVILDLNRFLEVNELPFLPDISAKYLYLLNTNYVGFLSTNNNCITLRRINDNENLRRYVKVIINPKNVNSNTFYSVPNAISLMYTHEIDIHVTEGIFDILSVYNMNEKNKEKNYYFASCGFGYITILKYLIYTGINTGLKINIYSDNDKSDRDHFKYLFHNSSVSSWLDNITLHRNTFENEKDYGVPLSRIHDSKFKVK